MYRLVSRDMCNHKTGAGRLLRGRGAHMYNRLDGVRRVHVVVVLADHRGFDDEDNVGDDG